MHKLIRFAIAIACAIGSTASNAETPDRVLSLAHPEVNWILQFELPDSFEQYNHFKHGSGSYAYGQTSDQRKSFSMVIHKYPGATDAKSCRDVELDNIRKNPQLAKHKIDQSESEQSAVLRMSGVTEIQGRSGFRQHHHKFQFRDGVCAKIHVSSPIDETTIAAELAQAADTMALKPALDSFVRSFRLPQVGHLKLDMQPHWGFQTSNPFQGQTRTLTIGVPDGNFQFMVTAFPAPASATEPAETITMKTADGARNQAAAIAVQTQIEISTLKGRRSQGHYIFVTDKTLAGKPVAPNNWKHMRQGMLKVGNIFATFTVFSNEEQSPDALRAMRSLEMIDFVAD